MFVHYIFLFSIFLNMNIQEITFAIEALKCAFESNILDFNYEDTDINNVSHIDISLSAIEHEIINKKNFYEHS